MSSPQACKLLLSSAKIPPAPPLSLPLPIMGTHIPEIQPPSPPSLSREQMTDSPSEGGAEIEGCKGTQQNSSALLNQNRTNQLI